MAKSEQINLTAALRLIKAAKKQVQQEISANAACDSFYGAGLATEGYAGGYDDALSDILLLIESGVMPHRRTYWEWGNLT